MTIYTKKNKVLIFGADSDLAKSIDVLFKVKYDLVGFSRNKKNKDLLNIKCNFLKKENILKNTKKFLFKNNNINSIIISLGKFNRSLEKYDNDNSEDFLITKNILEVVTKELIKKKINTRIIIIGSMDSFIPNTNSFKYSIGKSAISTLIKLYKKKYKKYKLDFTEIAPGPINTKMRIKKIENKDKLIQPIDISKICFALSEMSLGISLDTIKIYPKNWNYQIY